MKLDQLLWKLEDLRISSESGAYSNEEISALLISNLLEYIGNEKVSAAVDQIVF